MPLVFLCDLMITLDEEENQQDAYRKRDAEEHESRREEVPACDVGAEDVIAEEDEIGHEGHNAQHVIHLLGIGDENRNVGPDGNRHDAREQDAHIKSAENEIGAPLFQRTKRNVSLTLAGVIFLENAERILEEYDDALRSIAELQQESERVLRIGYLQCLIAHGLPRIHSRFSYEFPDISVQYVTYEFNEITDTLEAGEIDLAASFIPETM